MTEHRPFDANIPVLTEVIGDTPDSNLASSPGGAPPAPAGSAAGALLEAQAVGGWSDADWAILERRLSARILHQLQGRIDFVLEQRIKDDMAEVLRHALPGLTSAIRSGLEQTMEKIIARAVAQELTHLQALGKSAP
jgi:hypothetical protein